jgi:hypothetical protein
MPERTKPLDMRKGAVALKTAKTITIVKMTKPDVLAALGSQRPMDRLASCHLLFLDIVMIVQKLSNRCVGYRLRLPDIGNTIHMQMPHPDKRQ